MAGDWLKIEMTTPDKPEILEMSQLLGGMDTDAVFGKCFRVWSWFDQHTACGDAPRVTTNYLDRICGVEKFCEAMLVVGWLLIENERVVMPHFTRHHTKSSKDRALANQRQAVYREKLQKGDACGDARGDGKSENVSSLEKRREEVYIPPEKKDAREKAFEQFWLAYPGKKGSKQYALDAFSRKVRTKENIEICLINISERNARTLEDGWGVSDIKYIPHASTFLNKKMWLDKFESTDTPEFAL